MTDVMRKLNDMLCEELEEIARGGAMDERTLETAHKLTDTIKNIKKIDALDCDGDSYGRHYVRAHYSRDNRYSTKGRERIADNITRMMHDYDLSDGERDALRRAADAFR